MLKVNKREGLRFLRAKTYLKKTIIATIPGDYFWRCHDPYWGESGTRFSTFYAMAAFHIK